VRGVRNKSTKKKDEGKERGVGHFPNRFLKLNFQNKNKKCLEKKKKPFDFLEGKGRKRGEKNWV